MMVESGYRAASGLVATAERGDKSPRPAVARWLRGTTLCGGFRDQSSRAVTPWLSGQDVPFSSSLEHCVFASVCQFPNFRVFEYAEQMVKLGEFCLLLIAKGLDAFSCPACGNGLFLHFR